MTSLHRVVAASVVIFICAVGYQSTADLVAQAPPVSEVPRIWQGVYTAAQAARGKLTFDTTCGSCHSANLSGGRGPALAGEPFLTKWNNENLSRLFRVIRETMPRGDPGTLSDATALDIATYILSVNGFPTGESELTGSGPAFDDSVFASKTGSGPREVPNFTLVQAVGCLAPGPNRSWLLSDSNVPVATKEETATAAEVKAAEMIPPGSQTLRLVSAAGLAPASHAGRRVYVKGLINRTPLETLLNVTDLQTVAPTCGR